MSASTVSPERSARSCQRSRSAYATGRLAHHALEVVQAATRHGREPPAGYSPLVIVGPSGAGKSRLVSGMFIEHGLASRKGMPAAEGGGFAGAMWDGRSLGRDITLALTQDTLHKLRGRFAAQRLVIIDGVEQITAWDVQRVCAQLIDLASAGGATVIVTTTSHPMASPSLEPSLASRLTGGLVVPLPPPAAAPRGLPGGGDGPAPSLRRVIGATARLHGLLPADLTGPSRRRQAAQARGMAMYVARTLTGKSLQAIGRAFGGRDHTTVLHGIKVTEVRRSRDPAVAADIERLAASLQRP